MSNTINFGAPTEFGMHHFYVQIPASAKNAVEIYEDFGFGGIENQREKTECRIILARELWSKIRDDARKDFNTRLKAKKLQTGTWNTGKVMLDRFLGRELCVLAWAAEHATLEDCAVITQKWLALRPEERWWLYSKTAAEAGMAEQTDRGWRKALYCALSDGQGIKLNKKINPQKKVTIKKTTNEQFLFNFLEKGDI